jgi:ABC-2 type transport system permease protein
MKEFIWVEWNKVRKYTAFWVMLILYIVGVFGLNFIVYQFHKENLGSGRPPGTAQLFGSPFDYPDVWQTISWNSGWIFPILGLLLITLITNEYTFKTHRQNVIDGWTRDQFISVKWLWVFKFSGVATVVAFLTSLLFGAMGNTPFSASGMVNILWVFLQSISYMALALLFGVLIRKAGLAIVLYFLYTYVLMYMLRHYVNEIAPSAQVGAYLPLTLSNELIAFPFLKTALKGQLTPPPPTYALVIGSLVYPVLIYWWMIAKFRKSDL